MRTLKNKKILITGGSGFIGTHLIERLLKEEANVSILDVKKPKNKKVNFIKSTVSSWSKNLKMPKYDFVFHLSGLASVRDSLERPLDDFERNFVDTLKLLEKIRQSGQKPVFLFISTAAVYGIPKRWPAKEDDLVKPLTPYGASKLASEKYVQLYNRLYEIPSIILRPFSVYGPGQKKLVIFNLMEQFALDKKNIEVYGSKDQRLNLIYIDDLVEAMVILAKKSPAQGDIYNVGADSSISMHQLIAMISRVFGTDPRVDYTGKVWLGSNQKWQVSVRKIKNLGYHPKTDLGQGLILTKEWLRNIFTFILGLTIFNLYV